MEQKPISENSQYENMVAKILVDIFINKFYSEYVENKTEKYIQNEFDTFFDGKINFKNASKYSRNIEKTKLANLNDVELFNYLEKNNNNNSKPYLTEIFDEIYNRERKNENYYLTDTIFMSEDNNVPYLASYKVFSDQDKKLASIKINRKLDFYDYQKRQSNLDYINSIYHELQHERQHADVLRLFKGENITKNDKIATMLTLYSGIEAKSLYEFLEQKNIVKDYKKIPILNNLDIQYSYYNDYVEFDAFCYAFSKMEKLVHNSNYDKLEYVNFLYDEIDIFKQNFERKNVIKYSIGVVYAFLNLFNKSGYNTYQDVTKKDIDNFKLYINSQFDKLDSFQRYLKVIIDKNEEEVTQAI